MCAKGSESKRFSLFKIPYPPNPDFVGRTEILASIHLHLNAKPSFTSSFSLYGLGGVGKTQIAIQYAYEHRKDFDIICWLRANDCNKLVSSYVELSHDDDLISLGAPRLQDEQDSLVIAKQLKSWFESETGLKWLLIFDNADKLDDAEEAFNIGLVDLIPRAQSGSVLVTSRNRASVRKLAKDGCEVEEMKEDEAVQLLLKCSKCGESERNEQILVQSLGYLPLAIEQAGSFI